MDWSALRNTGCEVRECAPLCDYTTFQLGGPCSVLITCETPAALVEAVRDVARAGRPFHLIGGGSNLLVSDKGVDAVIIRYCTTVCNPRYAQEVVEVSGSVGLDDLVVSTISQGLDGLVFASGIPGTVGGAIAGNAGAFGKQIGDVMVSATLLSREGQLSEVARDTFDFSYRHSRLHESGDILVSARLRLAPGDKETLSAERQRILQLRRERHPDWHTQATAGSFFRNIEPTSAAGRRQAAGWFLEQAGAKTMRVGGAHVFEKHANIIIAEKDATASDVLTLSEMMAAAVKHMFSQELHREVRLLGVFDHADKSC